MAESLGPDDGPATRLFAPAKGVDHKVAIDNGSMKRPFRIALFMIMLLAGAVGSASGVRGIALAAASSYYVNGNGGADTNNTTCSQAAPCLTIGHAISAASSAPGSTIYIAGASGGFNGIYCEQITIDASLTLQALSSANPPAIDGGSPLPGGGTNPCGSVSGDAPGHSVLSVGNGSNTPTVILQGLIIQNGDASKGHAGGGGSVKIVTHQPDQYTILLDNVSHV